MNGLAWGRFCLAIACVLLLAAPAAAQFDRGTISGVVKDQSGAVVPGVTVTAKSLQTQELADGGHRCERLLHDDHAPAGALRRGRRTRRVQEGEPHGRGARRRRRHQRGVHRSRRATSPKRSRSSREATPIQTDVALRKTVEAKDIELLSFSGRNPIGVPALQAGRRRRQLQQRGLLVAQQRRLQHQRQPRGREHDLGGRRRSPSARGRPAPSIGVQNVDAIQEVQVLTANYLPEYGRASGGQIRFITKSGSSRYSGSASFFYRDDKLQANTWARNRSPNAIENSGPAPFDYKQYGYSFGGPIPGEMVQGQVLLLRRAGVGELLRGADEHGDGARPRRCGTATSASCWARTRSSARRRSSATRSPACRSRATSSRRTACRRTASR